MIDKKHEKHLAYYRMLEALRTARRCVFCDLECKGIALYFGGLLYEKVTDPGVRAALSESGGFCPRHARILASFGDGLGTAILYADQIKLRKESLETGAPLSRAWDRTDGACPACQAETRMRASNTRTLLQGLRDPEMRDALAGSAGLCFLHFTTVLKQADDSEVANVLMQLQKDRLESLSVELQEFISKYDYRRTSDEFRRERDSWLRAIEMVSGVEDVF